MQDQTFVQGVSPNLKQSAVNKYLSAAGTFWFQIAALGQAAFVIYIVSFYYTSTFQGKWENWNRVLPDGYIAGDWFGNFLLMLHLLLAATITFGGFIQLVPKIRKKAINVHRWNGRLYLITALIMSVSGIYLALSREGIGDVSGKIGIGLDGVLIIVFAALTWRYAVAKKIQQHQRWALRLFMVVSGVWFFRVGLMLWLMVHGKPVGFDPGTFSGPFLTFLNFACYMLPLLVLELYFWAKQRGSVQAKWLMIFIVIVCSVLLAAGIFAVVMGMWLPRIS